MLAPLTKPHPDSEVEFWHLVRSHRLRPLSFSRLRLIHISRMQRKWQIPRCRCPLNKGAMFDLNLDFPLFKGDLTYRGAQRMTYV